MFTSNLFCLRFWLISLSYRFNIVTIFGNIFMKKIWKILVSYDDRCFQPNFNSRFIFSFQIMKNPLWVIIWLLLLLLIAFWVSLFCAGWYVFIYPLTVCIPDIAVSTFNYFNYYNSDLRGGVSKTLRDQTVENILLCNTL